MDTKKIYTFGGLFALALIALLVVVGVTQKGALASTFSTDPKGLPNAQAQQTVELRDGDTYQLTASPVAKIVNGKPIRMLAYNGSVPGPTIKVPQNATITIIFTNNTDVDSTLHSHGVRGINANDGVPGVTQSVVKPGKSYSYKLNFSDAGIFWYHPHVREDYAQMSGLYGNFLVAPQDSQYWSPVNSEQTLILSDIALENGKIATFQKNQVTNTLMGRFGNTLLINGNTEYAQTVKAGEVVRYFVTNAANTRVFRLAIPNATVKLVGGDNGRVEQEKYVDAVTLGPSERAIIEVQYVKPGNYELRQLGDSPATLGSVTVASTRVATNYSTPFGQLRFSQDLAKQIVSLKTVIASPPAKQLTLGMTMSMSGMNMSGGMSSMNMGGMPMSPTAEGIEWGDTMSSMNSQSTKSNVKWQLTDQQTNLTGDKIDWSFKKGDKVKIRLVNDANSAHPMQHPIHLHGQRFLVTSINGKATDTSVWKDTVLVPQGQTVDIVVDMSSPGTWLLHCHIPEHMEAGMELKFKVVEG